MEGICLKMIEFNNRDTRMFSPLPNWYTSHCVAGPSAINTNAAVVRSHCAAIAVTFATEYFKKPRKQVLLWALVAPTEPSSWCTYGIILHGWDNAQIFDKSESLCPAFR